MKKKKIVLETIMEGPAGDLIVKPVEFESKSAVKRFAKAENKPFILHTLQKSAKEKKVKL